MTVAVETGLWQLDAGASTVTLTQKTMWGLVTVTGTFATVGGSGEVASDGAVTGTLTLGAASLDTKNAKRDEHLRGADFFDVDKHPEITYAVSAAEVGSAGDGAKVSGQLTVRGISKPHSATVKLTGVDADALTLETEFTVDRGEFGIGGAPLGMMRGLTAVTATLRFTRSVAA